MESFVHYDLDGGYASVGHFADAGANVDGNFAASADGYTEMAQFLMSTAEYDALSAANFVFS